MNKSYGTLSFGAVNREADIRHARDMSEVIQYKEWLEENRDAELYYMYRDIYRKGDKEKIREEGLRYDITIIPPLKMGKEYVKTKGHYHPEAVPGVSYPEIYEVLEGKAHYLLQKKSGAGLEDVVLIEAEAGEKALIPPNYGHITINPTEHPLKMANWVDREFESIYADILELGGGAYFELTNDEFVKNKNYGRVPSLRQVEPTEIPKLGIKTGENMYNLIGEPEKLDYLGSPEDYERFFKQIL